MPVLACSVRATAPCPGGPFLTGASEISAGGLHDLVLAPVPVVPGPYWYKKGVRLPLGGPHVAVTTSGTLSYGFEKTIVKCKTTDGEEIWNPAAVTPGEDSVTSFNPACTAKGTPCPPGQLVEIIGRALPWPSHLISASPVRDAIENIKLEVRCNGSFLDLYEGVLQPTVGNGVLVFGGALHDGNGHGLVVTGSDNMVALPGKVTAH